ncbi:MAG: H-X9-DG-CTERM domain-containing protein [Armatimonadota bacterium]
MPSPGKQPWPIFLAPYNEPSIYNCPSEYLDGTSSNPEYCFNEFVMGAALGDLKSPESTLMLADMNVKPVVPNVTCVIRPEQQDMDISARHNNGTVVSFADGHVEYLSTKNALSVGYALFSNGWILAPPNCGPAWRVIIPEQNIKKTTANVVVDLSSFGKEGYWFTMSWDPGLPNFTNVRIKVPSWVSYPATADKPWKQIRMHMYNPSAAGDFYSDTDWNQGVNNIWGSWNSHHAMAKMPTGELSDYAMHARPWGVTDQGIDTTLTINDTSVHKVTIVHCGEPGYSEGDCTMEVFDGNTPQNRAYSKVYAEGDCVKFSQLSFKATSAGDPITIRISWGGRGNWQGITGMLFD